MPNIQRRCERLAPLILVEEANLHRALSLSRGHRDSGNCSCAAGYLRIFAEVLLPPSTAFLGEPFNDNAGS